MGVKMFPGTPLMEKNVPKNKPICVMQKWMVTMATLNANLKNGGVHTKSIISPLQLILDY